MATYLTIYMVLVGLFAGSFINLAADRLPRGESVVMPRSHCRSCGRVLNFVDLLPVIGYLIRRGRCATCGTPIGASAPAVEAISGALVAVPILWVGLWPGGAVGLALIAGYGSALIAAATLRARSGSPPGTVNDSARRAR
jgi:leader peptidase (prepilin peptidase) / N-methyltransferase